MPKATLEYNLPKETEEFKLAMNAGKTQPALWKFSQDVLRKPIKYNNSNNERLQNLLNNPETRESILEIIELIRDQFYNVLEEEGVDLYA